MQISNASSSAGATASPQSSNNINKLQKQLRDLTDELRGVVGQDMDAKAKQMKVKMLQAQIQMVQQQIAAIQRQSQQDQANKMKQVQEAKNSSTQAAAARGKTPGLGETVDTFA